MEWHGPKTESSLVHIQLQADKVLKVLDGRGLLLRSVNLKAQQRVEVILSSNKGNKALLLKSPKEYDLVSATMPGESLLWALHHPYIRTAPFGASAAHSHLLGSSAGAVVQRGGREKQLPWKAPRLLENELP